MTWRDKAACKATGVAAFFSRRETPANQQALSACYECPVKAECLAYVKATEGDGLRYGIWGSTQASDR
jgi:hypothetical protein